MRNSKKIAVAGGTVLALTAGGVAMAYWSTSGTATGSATTSAGAPNLTIVQTSTIADMFPGDAPQGIAGTVTNNAANSAYVAKVVVSIKSVEKAAGVAGTCDASDYTLANPEMSVAKDIASTKSANFSGASIKFNNKNTNQDACKGATVTLEYVAS